MAALALAFVSLLLLSSSISVFSDAVCSSLATAAQNSTFCFSGLMTADFNGWNSTNANEFSLYNSILQAGWSLYENLLNTAANRFGFPVCQDCVTALKEMICASFFPGCNIWSCYEELATEMLNALEQCTGSNTTDAQDCLDDGFQSTGCQQFLADIAKLAQGSFSVTTCFLNQQSAIYRNSTCLQSQVMGRRMCTQFVDVCLCSPGKDVSDAICSYFPADGFVIDYSSNLACPPTSGWCSSSTSSSAGETCPNDYVCLAVPQSSLALSGMTNGFYVQTASASILSSPLRWFLGLAS